MARQLTKKQKIFADKYLETGNGTKSAMAAYDTDSERVAAVIASENLIKPDIRTYLANKASDAASMIYSLAMGAENEAVRLNASKDIMDRAGYAPVTKNLSVALKGNIEGQNKDRTALQALKDEYEEKLKLAYLNESQ